MTTRLQYIHFSLLGLSAIPIFSTIIIRNNNSGMALSESIQPDWSSIAMLALLSPLGIDLLLDVSRILSSLNLLSFFNTENIEGGRQSFLMIGEMLFVITGMLTSSLLHIMDHSLITYESARVLRCTYVVGATALSFSRVDKLFWPRWIETVVTVSFIASQIFRAYYDAFRSISNPHAQSMLILWITAGSIAAILFYAMGTIWMYKSYIHPYFLRNRIDVAVDDNELMNTASEHGDQVSARSQEGVRPKRLPAFLAAKVSRRILNFRTCENDGNPPHGSQEKLFIAVAILCTTIIFLSSLYEFQSKSYDLAAFIVTDISYILLELSLLLLPMRKAKSDVIHGTVSYALC